MSLSRVSHQLRRITLATADHSDGHRSASHVFSNMYDLAHRSSPACAQVQGSGDATAQKMVQRTVVCISQVTYMNIVTDGRSIRCRKVRAVNLHCVALAQRRVENE